MDAVKDLRLPWLWVGLWLFCVAATVSVSLGPPPSGPDVPASDKWMHVLTYFGLSALAVQIFKPGRVLAFVAVGLVFLGAGIEVAQGTLTDDRAMDWVDGVANTAGVLLGVATVLVRARDLLLGLVGRSPD